MKKLRAIELLGGSIPEAAKAIGCSYQAVRQWPEDLTPRIADRVVAALTRRDPAAARRALRECRPEVSA